MYIAGLESINAHMIAELKCKCGRDCGGVIAQRTKLVSKLSGTSNIICYLLF